MQHDATAIQDVVNTMGYGSATFPKDDNERLIFEPPRYPKMILHTPLPWADQDLFNEPRHFRLFASLRWLYFPLYMGDTQDRQRSLDVLNSFLRFFLKRDKKRWRGMNDHAAAFRLRLLCSLYEHAPTISEIAEFLETHGGDLHKVIVEHVRFITAPQVYRENHNHGLISALMLFQAADCVDSLKPYAKQAAYLVRQQVEHIFDPHGFAREHSLQYQWFNSNLTVHHFETLQRILGNETAGRLSQCAHAAKVSLMTIGALHPDRLLPLGDTTTNKSRQPGEHQPRDPGHAEAVHRRLLRATQSCVLAPEAGFFLRKESTEDGYDVLSSFSCAWHGYAHKQNDECSFTIAINGDQLIADPGYSRVCGRELLREVRSERVHSTVWSTTSQWSSRRSKPSGSKITSAQLSPNVSAVLGEHRRLENVHCQRVFAVVDRSLFFVVDRIEAASVDDLRRSFTLGSSVNVHRINSSVTLELSGSRADLCCLTPVSPPTLEPTRVFWDNKPIASQQIVFRVPSDVRHHVNLINLQPQRFQDVSITIDSLTRMQVMYTANSIAVTRDLHLEPVHEPCYVAHDGHEQFNVQGFSRWRSEH